VTHVPDTSNMDKITTRNALDSAARSHTATALSVCHAIMTSPNASDRDRLRAVEIMLNRGWGKATEHHVLADLEGKRLTKIVHEIVHLDPRPRELVGYKETNGDGRDR
jgi:hypothetical protein